MTMSTKKQFREIAVQASAEQATWYAAELVKSIMTATAAKQDPCMLALAGGTTPHGLYLMLAGAAVSGEVPWQNVNVFFGDERDVPQDHADSNYRMAQQTLLDHVPISPQCVHPMPADADDLAEASAAYEETIRRIVPAGPGGVPAFDLILLGMGSDGHTASLFPGTDALNEREKLVSAHFVPALGRNRMTFTYPLLNAAKNIILLVTGSDKAGAVEALLGGDQEKTAQSNLPAAGVQLTDGAFHLILDAAAARQTGLHPGE